MVRKMKILFTQKMKFLGAPKTPKKIRKVLMVCKYNRFRSKVSEAYLKKINPSLDVESAGVIAVDKPLRKDEENRNKIIKDLFGLKINGVSRGLRVRLLEEQDRIIVAADNVARSIFTNKHWRDKVEFWDIPDEPRDNKQNINRIVNLLISKINKLNSQLINN